MGRACWPIGKIILIGSIQGSVGIEGENRQRALNDVLKDERQSDSQSDLLLRLIYHRQQSHTALHYIPYSNIDTPRSSLSLLQVHIYNTD